MRRTKLVFNAKFILDVASTKLVKSAKFLRTYSRNNTGILFFGDTVYMLLANSLIVCHNI